MDRLTEKHSAGYDLKALNGEWCNHYCHKQKIETCTECAIYEAIQRLAYYEDLEEKRYANGIDENRNDTDSSRLATTLKDYSFEVGV